MSGFKVFIRQIPRSELDGASAKLVKFMSSGISVPSLVSKKSMKKQWEGFENQG